MECADQWPFCQALVAKSIVRINEKQWNAPTGDCLAMGAGLEVSGTLLYFPVFCKEHAARGRMGWRNEKPGAARRPGSWRSFGEYALLKILVTRVKRKIELRLSH